MSNFFSDTNVADNTECSFNASHKTIITNLYEGIPETLILNVIAWLLLISLFTVLRHQAWDYGRLALVNNSGSKKWTQVFYAHGSEDQLLDITTATTSTQNSNIDKGFFSWIYVTLRLKKDQILMHSGPDAVHYLSFQQHLMFVMAIITFLSITVILPVNFQGSQSGDANSFGHTTLSNLDPNSAWLWIHVVFAICYVPLVVMIMRRSSGRNAFKRAPIRTIQITNISPNDRNKTVIRNYIQELFPDVNVEDIQLAYNITKLTDKCADYERVLDARVYCEKSRNRSVLRPKWFSCQTVDALEYFQKEEASLEGEVARLRALALNEPLGIAFVTVSTVQEAQNIVTHFRPGTYREWFLTFAPMPSDIFWENLSVGASRWYIKWIAVNFILFFTLFFLTTPAIVVNLLDTLAILKQEKIYKLSPVISEFLPTLMLWTLSALMPVIVAFSDKWLSHWTRSLQNYSIMTKSFGYLLFMILILPSLGLTSAQAFLEWTINQANDTDRWKCIFFPDKGAFFVNYVITSAFIGTALELIRFPELCVYLWMLFTAKLPRAETPHIRKSILIEFPFGVHYAWTLTVFTISVVYSLACPLIMLFAMVYICFKHFVDKHNLYFAYGPSNMISQNGGKIHSTAVTMTKFSVILLLTVLAAIGALRNQGMDARAVVLIISLVVTMTLFTFMSPIKRCTLRRLSIPETNGPAPVYVADVLLNKRTTFIEKTGLNGYGSDTTLRTDGDGMHTPESGGKPIAI